MKGSKFYLVWREGSTGSTPTYKHINYEDAAAECERLTSTHGGKFHVLAHVATAEKKDIVFEEIEGLKHWKEGFTLTSQDLPHY